SASAAKEPNICFFVIIARTVLRRERSIAFPRPRRGSALITGVSQTRTTKLPFQPLRYLLGHSISNSPTQAQVQAIQNKLAPVAPAASSEWKLKLPVDWNELARIAP